MGLPDALDFRIAAMAKRRPLARRSRLLRPAQCDMSLPLTKLQSDQIWLTLGQAVRGFYQSDSPAPRTVLRRLYYRRDTGLYI